MEKSKKFDSFMKLARVIILSVFVANLVIAAFLFFVVPSQAHAAEINYEESLEYAKQREEALRGDGYVRVEVPIPGLTAQSVNFPVLTLDKNGELQTEMKKRYYVESLPVYITKIYSLSIGVLAVVAVVMIMVSGIKWIFAGGNAYSVNDAKKGITGAVSALVLALCSYMILYFISPRLVEVGFEVSKIGVIEFNETTWCDEPQLGVNNQTVKIYNENDVAVCTDSRVLDPNNKYLETCKELRCGETYTIKKEDATSGKWREVGKCMGRGNCLEDSTCVQTSMNQFMCLDLKRYCEKEGKGQCDVINDLIRQTGSSYGCTFDGSLKLFSNYKMNRSDDCRYDVINFCAERPVGCLNREVGGGICNIEGEYSRVDTKTLCTDSLGGIGSKIGFPDGDFKTVNCCVTRDSNGKYKFDSNQVKYCTDFHKCEDYENNYQCGADPCGLGDCFWGDSGYGTEKCIDGNY